MLLTRSACYGLIAVSHLAAQECTSSFSARDLASVYGFPKEVLAKILQRLAHNGVLASHHGIKGGYTLARNPDDISVLDVIKASEEEPHDALWGETWQDGRHQLRMVSAVVEGALSGVTIADMAAEDEQRGRRDECEANTRMHRRTVEAEFALRHKM